MNRAVNPFETMEWGHAMKFDLTERVIVVSNNLTGKVIDTKIVDGEQAYILLLDNPEATEDGTYCARESELRKPQD